jgi:anti-sigma factor RsiW
VTCEEADPFLMRYVFDEQPDAQRVRFEEHLAECRDCHKYLQSYFTTVRLSRLAFEAPGATAAEELPPQLLAALLSAAGA